MVFHPSMVTARSRRSPKINHSSCVDVGAGPTRSRRERFYERARLNHNRRSHATTRATDLLNLLRIIGEQGLVGAKRALEPGTVPTRI